MTEQKKIFGTDGVRGVANVEPVTAETALKLGRAAAYVFAQMNPNGNVTAAAKKLRISRRTLLRKINEMSAAKGETEINGLRDSL